MKAEEAYNQVARNLKAYESGDLLGGNPYSPIEKCAQQSTLSHDKVIEVLSIAMGELLHNSNVIPDSWFDITANKIRKLSVVGVSEGEIDKAFHKWYNSEEADGWTNIRIWDAACEWFQSLPPQPQINDEEIDKMAIEFADFKQYRKGEYHSDIIKSCKRGANWALNKLQSLQLKPSIEQFNEAYEHLVDSGIFKEMYQGDQEIVMKAVRIAAGLPPTPEKGGVKNA